MKTASVSDVRRYSASPLEFISDVLIPGADGPVKFSEAMADFQREAFEVLAPCLLAVAAGVKPPLRGAWIERTKGGSKDSDVGLCLLWLLLFSPRPLLMETGADDQDQAKETMKAMMDVVRLNPWMESRLEFQRYKIACPNTGSVLEFLTTDSTGAHGSRPAVTVCNELSHVGNKDFISTMLDNAGKIPGNFAIIATNAGFLRSWQHKWREDYRKNPRWWFQKLERPAPWIDSADVAEAATRNTLSRQKRLWWGIWAGEGDALDPGDVEACVTQRGPMKEWLPNWAFASGLDLGVKRDHAALVILGTEVGSGRVRLAGCQSWAPDPKTGQVDLKAVRQAQREAAVAFGLGWCGYDPNQAALLAQDLAAEGLPMVEVTFAGKNLGDMATAILVGFRERRVDLYRDEGLIDDLMRLTIAERRYGYKLEAISDERGHADKAIALSIVLPFMLEAAVTIPPDYGPDDDEDADYFVVP